MASEGKGLFNQPRFPPTLNPRARWSATAYIGCLPLGEGVAEIAQLGER